MKRILVIILLQCGVVFFGGGIIQAGTSGEGGAAGHAGHGLDPVVLVGIAAILIVAKLGGELFERFRQPAVLGELLAGIIIGNLTLFGFTAIEPLKTHEVIGALAEIGVIILLFEVGLESDLRSMMEVGWSSLLVAVAGVIAPFFLGWGVAAYYLPDEHQLVHIFIGATLCATSVGITARVLKDMGRLRTRESRIILGAAVIDDVLGLVILAVVAGAIEASAARGQQMTDQQVADKNGPFDVTRLFELLKAVEDPEMAEGRIQVLTHHTEHAVWQPRWLTHPNGARALSSLVIAVADVGEAASRFARFTGRAPEPTRSGQSIQLDRGRIDLVRREAFAAVLPEVAIPSLPFMGAYGVTAASLDAAATKRSSFCSVSTTARKTKS